MSYQGSVAPFYPASNLANILSTQFLCSYTAILMLLGFYKICIIMFSWRKSFTMMSSSVNRNTELNSWRWYYQYFVEIDNTVNPLYIFSILNNFKLKFSEKLIWYAGFVGAIYGEKSTAELNRWIDRLSLVFYDDSCCQNVFRLTATTSIIFMWFKFFIQTSVHTSIYV